MRILLIVLVLLFNSCGQSNVEKTKKDVAKSLGMEKKELDSKTYYRFEINSCELKGKTLITHSYVQMTNGFGYGADSKIAYIDVAFIDAQQGNSLFKVGFKNEKARVFDAEKGSDFTLCIENNGKTQTLKAKLSNIIVDKLIYIKASFADSRGSFADERHFEGVFVNQDLKEELNVKGQLQYLSNF